MSRKTKGEKKMCSSAVKHPTSDSTILKLKTSSGTQNKTTTDRAKSNSNLSSINHIKSPPYFIIIVTSPDRKIEHECLLNDVMGLTNEILIDHLIDMEYVIHTLKQVK